MIEKTYFLIFCINIQKNDIYFAENNIAMNILFSETEL